MSLSDQQFEFLKDVATLIKFVVDRGWKVTGGELFRPEEMQQIYLKQGKTTVSRSYHQDKLAIDLNFFHPENGLTYKKKDLQEIGDFWESLNELNSWGGNWSSFLDTPHFERKRA
jgi:hypothetical protein